MGSMSYIDDTFHPWGIRIISLDTLSKISPDNHRGVGISESDFKRIEDGYLLHDERKFTLLLTHYGPSVLGYDSDDKEKSLLWNRFKGILKLMNVNMWLYGHNHSKNKVESIEIVRDKINILTLRSNSITLKDRYRQTESDRSFNIIDLYRCNGRVEKAFIEIIHNRQDEINIDSKYIYELNDDLFWNKKNS